MSRKPAAKAGEKSAKAISRGGGTKPKAAKAAGGAEGRGQRNGHSKRLRPGQLDGLVLSFMHKNEKDLPMSAGTIAKGIGRSSGAVANCLERLAKAKKARLAKKAPRAYDLKGVNAR